jgi:hypothetical protein
MQQEILVILRSSFANGELNKNNEEDIDKRLSPEEKLEEACANGMIKEFLPEMFKHSEHKSYLWQVHPGFSFLQLEFGEAPLEIDPRHSIDPHNFLFTKCSN